MQAPGLSHVRQMKNINSEKEDGVRSLGEMKWEERAELKKVGFPGRSEWGETVELLVLMVIFNN